MGEIRIKPVGIEIVAEAQAVVHANPPQALSAPGGLYPMMARAYEVDEYRLMAGWPVEVPDYDIHAKTLVSCTGEVLADRESPADIETGALVRWTADEALWDPVALRWAPVATKIGPVMWEAESGHEPVLVDYEYRVDDERFSVKALNFDSDTQNYLMADFDGVLTGINGYTVLFVMSPNSVYDNNNEIPYNGLWTPQDKTKPFVDITMQGRFLWHQSESSERVRSISINPALTSTAPFYVAVVVDRPNTTYYVADGPNAIRVQSVPSGNTGSAVDMDVFLGRSTEDLDHTADMALLDLSVYPDRLSATEVRDEIALLSKVYGGDT